MLFCRLFALWRGRFDQYIEQRFVCGDWRRGLRLRGRKLLLLGVGGITRVLVLR